MTESFRCRCQNDQSTFMKKCILFIWLQDLVVDLDLGLNHGRNRIFTHQTGILQQMKLRKLLIQHIILLLNPCLCLKNRTRMTPQILANGHQCLMLVAKLRWNLINTCPTHLLHRTTPLCKQRFCFMRLDPDLVQMLSQRLPTGIRPFWIGNPNVATCVGKERRIQNFKKDVHFGFLTLRMSLGNLTKLDIVFPENVRDNSHQQCCILHQARAAIDNQVDSHYITSGYVL